MHKKIEPYRFQQGFNFVRCPFVDEVRFQTEEYLGIEILAAIPLHPTIKNNRPQKHMNEEKLLKSGFYDGIPANSLMCRPICQEPVKDMKRVIGYFRYSPASLLKIRFLRRWKVQTVPQWQGPFHSAVIFFLPPDDIKRSGRVSNQMVFLISDFTRCRSQITSHPQQPGA
jgi:hypothetical protein